MRIGIPGDTRGEEAARAFATEAIARVAGYGERDALSSTASMRDIGESSVRKLEGAVAHA